MRTFVMLIALTSCVMDSTTDMPPAPDLVIPHTWQGADDSGQPVVIMTSRDYSVFYDQVQHARIWMRQADVALKPE